MRITFIPRPSASSAPPARSVLAMFCRHVPAAMAAPPPASLPFWRRRWSHPCGRQWREPLPSSRCVPASVPAHAQSTHCTAPFSACFAARQPAVSHPPTSSSHIRLTLKYTHGLARSTGAPQPSKAAECLAPLPPLHPQTGHRRAGRVAGADRAGEAPGGPAAAAPPGQAAHVWHPVQVPRPDADRRVRDGVPVRCEHRGWGAMVRVALQCAARCGV